MQNESAQGDCTDQHETQVRSLNSGGDSVRTGDRGDRNVRHLAASIMRL